MAAMPKKTDPRIVVRCSQEDYDRLKSKAEKEGVGLATFVRSAALEKLGQSQPVEDLIREVNTLKTQRRENEAIALEQIAVIATFKCPSYGCEYRAWSAAAKCGAHGRTVVPV